mgnify:CR=1 FL=1
MLIGGKKLQMSLRRKFVAIASSFCCHFNLQISGKIHFLRHPKNYLHIFGLKCWIMKKCLNSAKEIKV